MSLFSHSKPNFVLFSLQQTDTQSWSYHALLDRCLLRTNDDDDDDDDDDNDFDDDDDSINENAGGDAKCDDGC